jgi:streptogramin lyase
MMSRLRLSGTIVLSAASLFVTGCSVTFNPTPDAPVQTPIGNISGSTYGGRQPIVGAKIYLFAAGTSAYGGPGIAAATNNASVSLLKSTVPAVCTAAGAQGGSLPCKDSSGNYYIFTDSGGSFNVGGEYSCTSGQQVYMYSVGGNAGAGVNTAASLMAVLGNCPSTGTLAQQTPFVYMNEVTTVAAAYALAGFASDAIHISTSGSSLGAVGIKNAFANAAQMANIATPSGPSSTTTDYGGALATTPGGNGIVPQKLINSIANVLAACVNSAGIGSSGACYTLSNDARSGGGQSGTQPTETATAAIYLAQHPYSAYVGTIFALASPTSVPFTPALSAAPTSFIVEILFSGGGVSNANINYIEQNVAIDGSGNVWTANTLTGTIGKFSPLGVSLSGTGFAPSSCSLSGTDFPGSIAINAASTQAWVGVANQNSVCVVNSSGTYVAKTIISGSDGQGDPPAGIAFDSSGNAWVTNDLNAISGAVAGQLYELSGSTYGILNSYNGTNGLNFPLGIAIQTSAHGGYIWVGNENDEGNGGNNCDSVFTSTGGSAAVSQTCNGSGNNIYGGGMAIDSSGNIWTVNGNTPGGVSETNPAGTSTSYFAQNAADAPFSISIDGVGNVWYASNDGDSTSSGDNAILEVNNSGTLLLPSTGYVPITDASSQIPAPNGVAVDGSGNVWYVLTENGADSGAYALRELVGAATPVATPIAYGVVNNLLGSRP